MTSSLLTLLVSILGSAEPCYGLMEVSSRLRYGVWRVWREYLSDHLVPPRACDSAHGLTGKERAISRLVAPGSRVTSEPGPHNGIALGAIHSVRAVCLPASEGVGPRVRIRLAPA